VAGLPTPTGRVYVTPIGNQMLSFYKPSNIPAFVASTLVPESDAAPEPAPVPPVVPVPPAPVPVPVPGPVVPPPVQTVSREV
jgi:hypothetical protein